jgi:hypothetical protein
MSTESKLKLLLNRRNILLQRDTDNSQIIRKLNRNIKKLKCKSGE